MSKIVLYIQEQYKAVLFYIGLAYFSYLMVLISVQYIPVDFEVAFLRIKQDVIIYPWYQVAFFTHVYTSVFALLAGFTQFSTRFRSKFPGAHRAIGKVYIAIILLFSAPSGLIMGYYANGGFLSQLAFCLLAVLWFVCTYLAYSSAIKKQFVQHRAYMLRSYALTLSAITLRLWKWILVALFEPAPMDVYRIVAWLGWVLNLLCIEWYIRNRRKTKSVIISR